MFIQAAVKDLGIDANLDHCNRLSDGIRTILDAKLDYYDLILLDILLPDTLLDNPMQGLISIRQSTLSPILVISVDGDLVNQAVHSGRAQDGLVKGFSMYSLRHLLRRYLLPIEDTLQESVSIGMVDEATESVYRTIRNLRRLDAEDNDNA